MHNSRKGSYIGYLRLGKLLIFYINFLRLFLQISNKVSVTPGSPMSFKERTSTPSSPLYFSASSFILQPVLCISLHLLLFSSQSPVTCSSEGEVHVRNTGPCHRSIVRCTRGHTARTFLTAKPAVLSAQDLHSASTPLSPLL
jgi:hypothetical protein